LTFTPAESRIISGTGSFAINDNANSRNQLHILNSTGAATFFSTVTATQFIRSGGTSSQFLKADGSVDSNTYLTTSAAASTYLPLAGGTMTGNVNWGQTDRGITWGFNTDGASIKFYNTGDGDTNSRLEFATIDNNDEFFRWVHIPSGGSLYESMRLVPNSNGNAQLIVSGSIIKSGGTSSQFLKADGSVDSNSYYLASNPSAFIALTALSGTAPIQYNNTTGAISITQASGSTNGFLSSTDWNTFNNKTSNVGTVTSVAALTLGTSGTDLSSSVANGTTTPVITLNVPTASAANRGALSASDWTTFNSKENAIIAGTTAQYYRGDKTFQTLNTAAVPELTNLYYTEARVNANTNVAANTAARHNAVTLGTANGLSLSTQELSLGLASSSANGALSSTDWTTFNNKQNALTNPVTGTGTTNYLPKFTGTSTIGNSLLFDNGTNVGVNTTSPDGKLDIAQAMSDGSTSSFTSPHLALTATSAINNTGFVGITFATSDSVNYGFSYGALRSEGGLGDLVWRNHFNSAQGTQLMRLTYNGNLGLGVTPSAWWSGARSMQIGLGGSIAARTSSDFAAVELSANQIINTSAQRVYIGTGFATLYEQFDGSHKFLIAPSGTAGNAISFTQAMTLGSNSGLSIGTPSAAPSQGLLVQGAATFSSSVTAGGNGAFNTTSAVSGYALDVRGATNKRFGVANLNSLSGASVLFYTDGNAFADGYIDASKLILQSQSGGNVGIGTDSPGNPLTISSNTISQVSVNAISGNTNAQINLQPSGTGIALIGPANDVNLSFRTNATIRWTITNNGILQSNGAQTIQSSSGILSIQPTGGVNLASVSGVVSSGGNINVGGQLTFTPAESRLISGSSSFAVNNNNNSENQFRIVNSTGAATFRSGIATNGYTASSSYAAIFNGAVGIGTNVPSTNNNLTLSSSTGFNLELINPDTGGVTWQIGATNNGYGSGGDRLVFTYGGASANSLLTLVQSTGNVLIGTTTDNGSRLRVNGSVALPHTTKSANYTLDATDYTVGFDCASNRTATLPDATTCAGRIYVIYQYNTNIGLRYVTIDGNGSQTINGQTTVNLQYQDEFSSVMIQSNGSNWVIIASALYAAPV
jgi:hypothetical protein